MSVPRSASLQVAHQRSCPNYTRTALDSVGARAGCKCKPSYYTLHRDRSGRRVRGPRLTNRRVAEQALRRLQVEIDEGKAGVVRDTPGDVTFREWADVYLGIVAGRNRKQTTIRGYQVTVGFAERAFGGVMLDEIGAPELREFARIASGRTDATLAKHLRHLSAIFEAAVEDDLLVRNPVPRFRKALRLRVASGSDPYTDLELAALWAAMGKLKYKPVYVAICKAATVTGMRVGELIAAEWGDLDLTNGTLRVRHTYNPLDGLTLPKDNEPRTVQLIPPALRVIEEWITVCGVQPDDTPIFQAPHGGRIAGDYLRKLVDQARVQAGIPDEGEHGRKRKPLHAFRATFDRLCLESGLSSQWVQAQLGHSDANLTLNVYGRWSAAATAAEAAKINPEAFPV